MSHKLKYLAGAAGLSALLIGPAMADPVQLTFWDISGNQGGAAELAAFEAANPDIKVNLVSFESEDYKTQLRLTVAGGNVPDLYVSNGGFGGFNRSTQHDRCHDALGDPQWCEQDDRDYRLNLSENFGADGRPDSRSARLAVA